MTEQSSTKANGAHVRAQRKRAKKKVRAKHDKPKLAKHGLIRNAR